MLKGFRTILVNLVLLLPLLGEILIQIFIAPEFGKLVPSEYAVYYAMAVVVVNLFLRTITTGPVGTKE